VNRIAVAAIAIAFAISCRGANEGQGRTSDVARSAAAPLAPIKLPSLSCFSTDTGTIAFGGMDTSAADQDVSGTQFSFEIDSGGLVGYVRDAAGEIPPRRALQDLRFDARTDSLTFWYSPSPNEKSLFQYHVTCQRLAGEAHLFATPTSNGVVVRDTLRRSSVITQP